MGLEPRLGVIARFVASLLLLSVGLNDAARAEGAWVMERIGYQDTRGETPNHLTNPDQKGGRGSLQASVFFAQRSKFTASFEWGDPPTVIHPGSKVQILLSMRLLENNNSGNYSLFAQAAANALGDVYPEKSCCVGGATFADALGANEVRVSVGDGLGTHRMIMAQRDAPGPPGQAVGGRYTVRVILHGVGYEPRYYYIYRWAADGRPGEVQIDPAAGPHSFGPPVFTNPTSVNPGPVPVKPEPVTPTPVTPTPVKPVPMPSPVTPVPVPVKPVAGPVVKFSNYNSHVECRNTDQASFTLQEPLDRAQAILWYDFGGSPQGVAYTLSASGRVLAQGPVRKTDCAVGYTWCHGVIELGHIVPGTYTVTAAPGRICHNPTHDRGNGFVMVTGVSAR